MWATCLHLRGAIAGVMHLIVSLRTVDVSMDEWWWQNDAENDVLNERYEKHGNIVSGRTRGSSKFSLRRDEIVKRGLK